MCRWSAASFVAAMALAVPASAEVRLQTTGAVLSGPPRVQVRVDLASHRATVQRVDRSVWSALRISHTFSGSRYNNPSMSRDWLLTSVWVFAMDALAAGLLVMVFGSYYMWYQLKAKRTLGWLVLAAGVVSCGLFVFGLA